jgi:cyclase
VIDWENEAMRRISKNVYTEVYYWGCNPSFITTSDGVFMVDTPQQPVDAVRWKEKMLEHGRICCLCNTEPHGDHVAGNRYFPGVDVIGQIGLKARYEQLLPTLTGKERLENMKVSDPDSVWLFDHPDYPPNPPTRLFEKTLTIHLGNHTIELINHPGHTAPQTTVYLPDEGVAITGDNVFCGCMTFIQEANPWDWLRSLAQIDELDVEVIVPGHGEPTNKLYLRKQAQIIEEWIGAVENFWRRGLSAQEAIEQPAPKVDPYPIGQRLFASTESLPKRIIANLYRQIDLRNGRATA